MITRRDRENSAKQRVQLLKRGEEQLAYLADETQSLVHLGIQLQLESLRTQHEICDMVGRFIDDWHKQKGGRARGDKSGKATGSS